MQSKWTSRKLWMSVITIIAINLTAYLGAPELEEPLITQSAIIFDAILEMVQLLGSAAVAAVYVVSEARIDTAKVKNGRAPK